jgi:diaminopimelate epimerase
VSDYAKYHGLGNDYLVIEPETFAGPLTPAAARHICDRHRGVGADGIMYGPLDDDQSVRIFNPDGSEAEKSGNGLRIFARYLWERGHVHDRVFTIETQSGPVEATILDDTGARIAVAMGRVRFDGPSGEALEVAGRVYFVHRASIGNPHCVVPVEQPTPALARELGPAIERHALFPERTNVQFMAVLDEHRIRIEIWERGAGYTEASGTSSCAAAAVACRLGQCRSPIEVHMPGGALTVQLDGNYRATLVGEVASVGSGTFSDELLAGAGMTRR